MPREYCYTCMRAICLCDKVESIKNQRHVIILQDINEFKHPKNTAKLLNLSLKNSDLYVEEDFRDVLSKIKNLEQYLLIFPHKYLTQDQKEKINILGESSQVLKDYQGIILLDGTWKKAKKAYFSSPQLQALDHYEFKDLVNEYSIRVSPNVNSLSTFEAGYFALKQLKEPNIDKIYGIFKCLNKMSLR